MSETLTVTTTERDSKPYDCVCVRVISATPSSGAGPFELSVHHSDNVSSYSLFTTAQLDYHLFKTNYRMNSENNFVM
eukprot:6477489-Amphidinium_carterae.1